LMEAIRSSWAPSTLQGYSRAVNLFFGILQQREHSPKTSVSC
jgi:hypothetical protein